MQTNLVASGKQFQQDKQAAESLLQPGQASHLSECISNLASSESRQLPQQSSGVCSSNGKQTSKDNSNTEEQDSHSLIQNLSIQEIDQLLDNMTIVNHNSEPNNQQPTSSPSGHQQHDLQNDKASQGQQQDQISLQDVIVNKQDIIFGMPGLVPGAIDQIDLNVTLAQKQQHASTPSKQTMDQNGEQQQKFHTLRILSFCRNKEFDCLDEYVFSVRSPNCFQYYEQIRFKIRRGQRADVKVAVKIPMLKNNYIIHGIVQIRIDQLPPIEVPVIARCLIPQIICQKSLYNESEGVSFIKIPARKGSQRCAPIPFKNLSPFQLSLDIQTISLSQDNKQRMEPFSLVCQNFVQCLPNTQFFVNMQLLQNINYIGKIPTRYAIRRVLLLKIRNSSMMFHFPVQVTMFEGIRLEGN